MMFVLEPTKVINNPIFIIIATILVLLILILLKNIVIEKQIIIIIFKSIRKLGYFIVVITSLLLLRNLINAPYEESSKHLLSAFGLLSVLSSLCFSMTNHLKPDQKSIVLSAGKKFLHAALIIILCILLTYISSHSHITGFGILITTFRNVLVFVTNTLIIILGFTFLYLAYDGYKILFDFLWQIFEFRTKELEIQNDFNEELKPNSEE